MKSNEVKDSIEVISDESSVLQVQISLGFLC